MASSKKIVDRRGRTWTLSKVTLENAEDEDFRFWYEEMTPEQRMEAVYEALEMCLKMKDVDAVPDYVEFIGSLNEHRVKYFIVGAKALAYHARPPI